MGTFIFVGILLLLGVFTFFFFMENNDNNSTPKSVYQLTDAQKDFLEDARKRITIKGNNIYIQNHHLYSGISNTERETVVLEGQIPKIRVFENDQLIKKFVIEPKDSNPNLDGQIFDCEILVHQDFSVQIRGAIYRDMEHLLYKKPLNVEDLRFQPFYLSHRKENNEKLVGRGMVARGLHFTGYRDGGNLRLVCICDSCQESFSVDSYHAGFSDAQYFYSTNSKETLMVSFDKIREMPYHYEQNFDKEILAETEKKLPKTEDGEFRYYNPFCCPHCLAPYNDYQKFKEDRPGDIYAHYYLNKNNVKSF